MRVELSTDPRDFARHDWSHLVTVDPAGTIFHTPTFLKLYWEEFGTGPDDLLLAFGVDDDGAQVGAAAFERVGRTLRFLGGTEVVDYLGPVAEPDAAPRFADALLDALVGRDDWDEADLRGLPEDRAWLALLAEAARSRGLRVEVLPDQNAIAPSLALPGSWDAYLEGLPSKLRHEIRRKARKLEAEAGPFRVVVAHGDTFPAYLDRFVDLHRTSEGPKGVFMQPGMEIFFRRLAEALLPRGIFQLTFIEVGDRKLAGTIGFRFDGTYFLYNSAFDRETERWSPGMVLVGEDIRIAIEGGCTTFDLLKGDYAYKYRFGAARREIRRLVVSR